MNAKTLYNKIIGTSFLGMSISAIVMTGLDRVKKEIPVIDRIIDKTEIVCAPVLKHKTVLIIDNFKDAVINVNRDFPADIAHGYVVSRIIETALDSVNVIKKHCPFLESDMLPTKHSSVFMDSILTGVLKNLKNKKRCDIVNISAGFSYDFKKLSKILGIEITPENIAGISKDVKSRLRNYNGDKKGLQSIGRLLDTMDTLCAKGTKFYIAAGNDTKSHVNLLNLTDGAVNVGALDSKGQKLVHSCDNSLVNRWENGEVTVKRTVDGFCFTDSAKTDVTFNQTSNFLIKKPVKSPITGTSFSTPRAIASDLKLFIYK